MFTEGEGDLIESGLPFKIFSTLPHFQKIMILATIDIHKQFFCKNSISHVLG